MSRGSSIVGTIGNAASHSGTFRPQLTSLVDVMTILLVFLIKSFSVEGNIVTPSPDLELPWSSSEKPARPVCTIEVTKNDILSEGSHLISLDSLRQSDSLMVPVLYDWMTLQKAKCVDTTKALEVLIQSDKEIPFAVIKKVMYSCSKAGVAEFSVLVLQEE
jgi:biopolymer transport protein ExbD